ncbi:unnamed protein product [Rhizophagus irregularis]|nr:unnamed protein product [Rhizophagus irregularis]
MTEQFELSEFLNVPSTLYYCGFKASNIGISLYKIRDDSIKPRHFLGADNEDEIEAILSEHEGHSLHEIIDGNEPLCPVIDFDLPQEVYNNINPKLTCKEILDLLNRTFRDVCLEISPDWNKNSITVASSTDAKKYPFTFLLLA